jgi:hypothetical protein
MNYEFHVGDYVETYSGAVGYIISIEDDAFTWVNHTPIRDGDDVYSNVEQRNFYSSVRDVFARIGAYDFTKKEKKRIEPISDCNKHIFANAIKSNSQIVRVVSDDILNKINELVDAVNKLMDKEDQE